MYEPAAQIEQAMMGYDAVGASIGGPGPGSAGNIGHLRAMARSAYQGYQATRYDDTGRLLPALIREAEAASRAAGLDDPEVCAVRALVYDTAAALLNRVGRVAPGVDGGRPRAGGGRAVRPSRAGRARRVADVIRDRQPPATRPRRWNWPCRHPQRWSGRCAARTRTASACTARCTWPPPPLPLPSTTGL